MSDVQARGDLLTGARASDVDVSRRSDKADSHEEIRREPERRWASEYADFVAAHNATIAAEGLPLEAWRAF